MKIRRLSIIIPVYNEESTISKVIKKVQTTNLHGIKKEIIIVNDGSTDSTKKQLSKIRNKNVQIIHKRKNYGKGSAIKTALKQATGDLIVIQDADLEYNPDEYKNLLVPFFENDADVVYGSRFVTTQPRRVLYFWHSIGNSLLTNLTNVFANLNLTDMETCYKMFTRDVAKRLNIQEKRFGFEPEFTLKIAKMDIKIFEVGIGYSGRNYKEGKKINWKDGLWALWCIIKYNFIT